MNGTLFKLKFIQNPQSLFELIDNSIIWDSRMKARKTASFVKAYNYSQMSYPFQAFPSFLEEIRQNIQLFCAKVIFSIELGLKTLSITHKSKIGHK